MFSAVGEANQDESARPPTNQSDPEPVRPPFIQLFRFIRLLTLLLAATTSQYQRSFLLVYSGTINIVKTYHVHAAP